MTRRRIAVAASVAAAPLIMAVLIHHYGVNVPYWDEWITARVPLRARLHTLDLAGVWAQHNEHRLVFVNLVAAALARWSDYDLVGALYVAWLCQVVALALTWRLIVLTAGAHEERLTAALAIGASWLLFWTAAADTWIWAIAAVEFLSSVLWAVGTVWALTEWPGRWRGVVIASAFASMAVLNAGTGFPVLVLLVAGTCMSSRCRGSAWLKTGAVSIFALALTLVYLHGWQAPVWRPSASLADRLVHIAAYALTFLGSLFQVPGLIGWRRALVLGAVGVAGLAWMTWVAVRHRPHDGRRQWPWLLLASYSWLNAALTAWGRVVFGPEQALATRYAAIVTPAWVALGVLVLRWWWRVKPEPRPLWMKAATTAMIGIGIAAYGTIYAAGLSTMRDFSDRMRTNAGFVRGYETADDAWLSRLYENAAHVRAMARDLDRAGLTLFSQPAPRFEPETAAFGAIRSGASATGACTLDEINGRPAGAVVAVPRGILGMFGWAADPERSTGEAHRFVELASAGRRFVLEAEPMRRADVARALADSRLEDSGFHATGSVRDLPPGDYRIALILQTADRAISCEFPQTLSLAP